MTFSGHVSPPRSGGPLYGRTDLTRSRSQAPANPVSFIVGKELSMRNWRGGEGARQWGEAAVPNEKFTRLGVRKPECKTVPGTQQMFNSNKIISTKEAEKFTFF